LTLHVNPCHPWLKALHFLNDSPCRHPEKKLKQANITSLHAGSISKGNSTGGFVSRVVHSELLRDYRQREFPGKASICRYIWIRSKNSKAYTSIYSTGIYIYMLASTCIYMHLHIDTSL
jgi:hypothetical protein